MKKVYSSKGGDQAGYPLRDGIGCYTVVEDDELETCLATCLCSKGSEERNS